MNPLLSRWRQAVVARSSSKMHSALGMGPVPATSIAAATSTAWFGQSCTQKVKALDVTFVGTMAVDHHDNTACAHLQ